MECKECDVLRGRIRQLEAACILGDAAESFVRKTIIKENEVLLPYLEMESRAKAAESERDRFKDDVAEWKKICADMEAVKDKAYLVAQGADGAQKAAMDRIASAKETIERLLSERDALREQVKALNELLDKREHQDVALRNSWAEDAAENVELKAKLAAMEERQKLLEAVVEAVSARCRKCPSSGWRNHESGFAEHSGLCELTGQERIALAAYDKTQTAKKK